MTIVTINAFGGGDYGMAGAQEMIIVDNDIYLIPLGDSVFIHQSWHWVEGYGRFASNGMIIVKNGDALMIDTPMDNEKTEVLTRFIKDSLSAEVSMLIVGHFHDDCLGGLSYLHRLGVESIAHNLTIERCNSNNLSVPSKGFTDSLVIDFHGRQFICKFFGAGHSFDNITVWMPESKILFGGCLVKSSDSRGLGNLSDAVVIEWAPTIRKIINQYPDIRIVVPGHGDHGGTELLLHTISLTE